MRSAVPLFRTPATPWAIMRSPRRTAAAMPKRLAPLPSIDSRMASTLTGALSSWDGPAGLNRSDFDASIISIAVGGDSKSGLHQFQQENFVNPSLPRVQTAGLVLSAMGL